MLCDTIRELHDMVARNSYKHTPYVMLRKEYLYSILDRMEQETIMDSYKTEPVDVVKNLAKHANEPSIKALHGKDVMCSYHISQHP